MSRGHGSHSSSRYNSSVKAVSSPSSLKIISLTIRNNTSLQLMRQPPQHFILSVIPRLHASAYAAVNVALYFVYAALTVAPDFDLEAVERVHSNDTFAD